MSRSEVRHSSTVYKWRILVNYMRYLGDQVEARPTMTLLDGLPVIVARAKMCTIHVEHTHADEHCDR